LRSTLWPQSGHLRQRASLRAAFGAGSCGLLQRIFLRNLGLGTHFGFAEGRGGLATIRKGGGDSTCVAAWMAPCSALRPVEAKMATDWIVGHC